MFEKQNQKHISNCYEIDGELEEKSFAWYVKRNPGMNSEEIRKIAWGAKEAGCGITGQYYNFGFKIAFFSRVKYFLDNEFYAYNRYEAKGVNIKLSKFSGAI